MAENKIVGYKNIFGFVLPDWVDEGTIRILVTFLLSSAVMLFVLIFVIWPKFSDISTMRLSLNKSTASLTALKNSKSGFDKLSEQIPENTQNLVLSAIPQVYAPENAVFLLRQIASETPGLSIVSYKLPSGVLFDTTGSTQSTGASGDMVGFISFPVRLTVTAPVDSLLSFINKIETSLPFGVVSDLGMQEVSKLVKSTTTKSVQVDLEVKYYQAVLKKVDISKISPISAEDLALVKQISSFSSARSTNTGEVPGTTTFGTSTNLFGF